MPDWNNLVRARLEPLRLKGPVEWDLTEELVQHLEDYYRELCSGSASEADAYRKAMAELEDIYLLRARSEQRNEVTRPDDAKHANYIEELWRDFWYAGRTLRKSPLFVLVVVLTL